jgi:hypothetical protein
MPLVFEELCHDPTIKEVIEALKSLISGKVPGKDDIPAEILKCCTETAIQELYEILGLYWNGGTSRHANIVTLYKNKDDRSTCKN